MNSKNAQATQIVDKNGKLTTVYKNPDKGNTRNLSSGLTALPIIGAIPKTAKETPIPPIGYSTELARYDFETSPIFEDIVSGEDGSSLSSFSEEYDDPDIRIPYLAGEDGVAAVAHSIDSAPYDNNVAHSYDVQLSMFDGNTGKYRYADVPYRTGSAINHAPSVGDVMTAFVNDAYTAEQYPLTDEGVKSFSSEYGFEESEDNYKDDFDPYHDARKTLTACHEAAGKLKALVGEVRYGDYIYGRDKADYGYDSGITYSR